MNAKGIISKLLVFKKSATFVLIAIVSFANCNQIFAEQVEIACPLLYLGPPTTATSSTSSTSGGTK